MTWLALGVALLCHLWAANRGLEMTDEASYLLIALDPWKTLGHGTFHGFLLRPLYLLGGESVVGLRWIGYAVLLVSAWRLASAIRLRLGSKAGAVSVLAAPVLMVGAMTCTSAGMRTPCYNWMILVGALWMWSGWLRCGIGRLGPIELGLGLAMAVLGKWGAALVLAALFAGLSLMNRKAPFGPKLREWQGALLTFGVATLGFGMYADWQGIRDTLQAGILIAKTTGSHGWFIVPKYGWEIFYYLYRIGRAFVWLLPPILVFWWLARRDPRKWTVEKIATILFVAGLSLAAIRGWWRGGIEQFGKESVLAGCWLLGVAWTVWAVRRTTEDGRRTPEDGRREAEGRGRWSVVGGPWSVVGGQSSVVWGLVLTPFLCGIGTNTSIADYAGQGTVFFATAGILLLGRLPSSSLGSVAGIALTGLGLIQASRVSTSLLGMYRVGSVLGQTEALGEGPEAGRLWVDPQTATEVREIVRLNSLHGFRPGDPVVGIDSLCGWVYLSGATSPGVPWFFRDQRDYLSGVLSRVDPAVLQRTRVWLRSSSQLQSPAAWWPSTQGLAFPRRVGEVELRSDRGRENLVVFSPEITH